MYNKKQFHLLFCAFILNLFVANAVAANMSDEEFTTLTGSGVKDALCTDAQTDENTYNWAEKVANIQLKLNVEKFSRNVIKKLKKNSGVSSNKHKYRKIKVKIDGIDCWMSGKYRLTGDLEDHIGTSNEIIHSLKIKINDGRINNILKFKLLAPKTRTGKFEVLNYVIHRKLSLLAPRTALINVQIAGQTYKALFQEDISEQLLEHNNLHEAILLEGNEGFKPFTFPKIINRGFVESERFKAISMYVLENLGKAYLTTAKFNRKKNVDIPIFLDFLPNSSKEEFIYFYLLNFSLNSVGGLTTDDSRFVFDHISRKYRPIYYDGHARERMSKISDLNFNVPDNIQFKLLKSLETLDLVELEAELNDLGAQFSIKELQEIMNDAITFVKAAEGKKVLHELGKTSKNLIDYELIKENAQSVLHKNDMERLQVSWMLNTSELEKCVYRQSGTRCGKNILNYDQKLVAQSETQSLSRGIFLHGLSEESLMTPYFQELAFNTLPLLETGTIIEHTSNLELSINAETKTVIINSKYQNASTSQVKVSEGIIDDWEFIVKKGVFLGYPKHPGTRASKFGLTGCLTFNDLNVKSLKVQMQDAMCEDSIHFVRTKGDIESITVTKTLADAIDADFSELIFSNLNISDAGNDCVDFSAGAYQITNSKFHNCGDKGVSAGEGSDVVLENSEIRNALIGIVAKDGSTVLVEELELFDVDVCLAAYKKKQEHDTAHLDVKKIHCPSENYFTQNGSHLSY